MNRLVTYLAISVCLLPVGCGDPGDEDGADTASWTSDALVHMPFSIHDAHGRTPTDPLTPLYEVTTCRPLVAPDGHHVTFGEFNRPTGSLSITCLPSGTRVAVKMHGLIPNGLYTVWNLSFRAPGFDPTFANVTGVGMIGPADGSGSVMIASAAGDASLSAVTPAGPLSTMGTSSECAMRSEFEWHVLAAYHIDGRKLGAKSSAAVEQAGWFAKQP
jgi:hypothetical protein